MPAPVTRRPAAALLRLVCLALLAAAALTCLPAGAALAADGDVTWTVRTASNSYGKNRSSFSYTVNPGGTVKDAMVVANRSRTPLTLAVYASDGFTTDKGQLDLLTRDKKSVGVGAWTQAGRRSIEIGPGETAEIPFTVAVPDNATPGDYAGGILTSLQQADEADGISVDRRLGIRVGLRVSGALKPALTVEDLHVDYAGTANPFGTSDATVTYRIHNAGNAIMSARQTVAVGGPFGWFTASAAKVPASPELLPGESWKMTVPVHGVTPAVRLGVTVTLTPLLTDASGSINVLDPVRATAHGWALPWTLALLVLLLAAAVVAAFVLVRRRRRQRKSREDDRVRTAVEQALRDRSSRAESA
jgi:hypothetical protein